MAALLPDEAEVVFYFEVKRRDIYEFSFCKLNFNCCAIYKRDTLPSANAGLNCWNASKFDDLSKVERSKVACGKVLGQDLPCSRPCLAKNKPLIQKIAYGIWSRSFGARTCWKSVGVCDGDISLV